ncbi:MAG: monovalent cation:proton antiporter-2 (CPA2) family protein [Deltaproteobacteria bacterium]|nr:monovalent cation:proton antiporter-2 (CPA2) family protein [Deltaproteobacteria bacterium]MCW5803724.1 monovalent cation:proton antiporter-2 (CPA2) family protein [Deltaproteobacteria bacterium]
MTDSVLAQALVYLAVAVIFVPIAKRLGLGAVLGYLAGGVVIGPWVLGFVGGEGQHVMHFAEFGVVMMLFLVGLELRPALLWQLRQPIFGLGGLQVVVTAAVVAGGALAVGVAWKAAIAIGLTFAMSSTAIVLSSLSERGLLKTSGGQASFSVLLFQDISVIPILAVFPLLGATVATELTDVTSEAGRPAWLSGLFVLGAVVAVVGLGRYLVRPVFQFLAAAKLREAFTAAALLIVVGIALLMQTVGLSPALGTFLAGVVLADSEYRHELETDIEPFKGLLLGLFFISVGAQIDFGLIGHDPLKIAAIVAASMLGKLSVLYGLGRLFKLDRPARWLLAFSLAQVGEFAFVLLSLGAQRGIFAPDVKSALDAAVAISMVLSPPAFIVLERFVLPRVTERTEERAQDEIDEPGGTIVIAGYGRFGQMVGRMLRANRIPMTILDLDPEIVDIVGRLGIKVYYGDASRTELLHAAGCEHARAFVLAVDDAAVATRIAENVRHHFPNLAIIARCRDRPHYWELRRLGIKHVFRETFGSAYEAGIASLQALGYRANTAHRLARRWRQHEERMLEELGELWGTGDGYFSRVRSGLDEAERLMRDEDPTVFTDRDASWDNESLRADRRPEAAAADDVAS